MISSFTMIRRTWTHFALACVTLALNQLSTFAQSEETKEATILHDDESVMRRIQNNAGRLRQIQQSESQLRTMLASIPQPSQGAVTKESEKNTTLRWQLAVLEKVFNEFRRTNDLGSSSIDALEKQLSDVLKERDQLVKKQAGSLSKIESTNRIKGLRQEIILGHSERIPLKLTKNRIVPVMEPFYIQRRAQVTLALTGKQVDGVVLSRVHDGEPVGNAVGAGGLLETLLRKYDPAKASVLILVCPDSIPAFHAIAEVLPQLGFAYSWETANDEDSIFTLDEIRHRQASVPISRGYIPKRRE